MTMQTLEERFNALEQDYNALIATKYVHYSEIKKCNETFVDSAKNTTWVAKVKKLIEDSYGKESDYYIDFEKAGKAGYYSNYGRLKNKYKPLFDAAKDDLAHSHLNNSSLPEISALSLVLNILNKFPSFARKLKRRYNDRTPLEINDEYDVQDMLYAILTLHFDDIRAEEYTPSFGGGSSRQDFLLKKERIVIEVKKTRKTLNAAKVGGEALIDMARYRIHQECDVLVFFIYDPDHYVDNPQGVINDLESQDKQGRVKVVIAQ
ncbi:malate dehydrogenase [Candidatus Pantoea soli]|uniref:Malate dehydrogenase n=1 Tax=Candidatus Pantoea soli TaxID=3098669 RepID=A0A518XJY0_9GAMM|nr:malate dehydrogenase [Pantoea soli]QDY44487.1 malate dehydrogenase [Pantoea soli]